MDQRTNEAFDVFSYCLRCGSRTLDKSVVRAFRCETCGFEFFHNSAAAVAALLEYKDGLLVTVRRGEPAQGTLDLPGGFIDHQETAEDALRRELAEELSLGVRHLQYVGSYPNRYPFGGIVVHTLDLVFRCQPVDPDKKWTTNDEVANAMVVPLTSLRPSEFGLDSIRHIVSDYVAGRL